MYWQGFLTEGVRKWAVNSWDWAPAFKHTVYAENSALWRLSGDPLVFPRRVWALQFVELNAVLALAARTSWSFSSGLDCPVTLHLVVAMDQIITGSRMRSHGSGSARVHRITVKLLRCLGVWGLSSFFWIHQNEAKTKRLSLEIKIHLCLCVCVCVCVCVCACTSLHQTQREGEDSLNPTRSAKGQSVWISLFESFSTGRWSRRQPW